MTIPKFQKTVLDWHKDNRRNLPWRNTKDPYKILVSEIMLQQTQVSRVLPKYEEFLKAFPTPQTLAKTSDKKLLKVWSGLGYWRRAKYLKETANILTKNAETTNFENRRCGRAPRSSGWRRGVGISDSQNFVVGAFPRSPEELEKLPGIGHYTARALACFAFGSKDAFLDTNIRRVYLHFFFQNKKEISDKQILKIAQQAIDTLPKSITPREWHYALFDYGALVLKDKSINKRSRTYAKQSKFKGSFRSYRTKVIRFLLAQPKTRATHTQIDSLLKQELVDLKGQQVYTPQRIIDALLKDKLMKQSKTHYFL